MDEVSLTPYQITFYYEWLLNPLRSDYNIVWDQELFGTLDLSRLNESLRRFINDHYILHSNVFNDSDNLIWLEREIIKEDVDIVQFYNQELDDSEKLRLAMCPFDLEKDLLIRFNVIKIDKDRFRVIIIMPHIIIDGLSFDEFITTLSQYYNDPLYHISVSLAEQVTFSKDLTNRLNVLLSEGEDKMTRFWQEKLQGITSPDLGFLKMKKEGFNLNPVGECRFYFDENVVAKIRELYVLYNLTPFYFTQLVFAMLLYRITREPRIGLSYPVGIKEGSRFIYGANVNTIINVYDFCEKITLREIIDQLIHFRSELDTTEAKYLPVNQIVKYTEDKNILHLVFAQTNLKDSPLLFDGLEKVLIRSGLNINLFFTVFFEQELCDGNLNFRIRYDNQLLDKTLIFNFSNTFQLLLHEVLHELLKGNLNKTIDDFSLLNSEQYDLQVNRWNDTQVLYPDGKTIHELFEDQVLRSPDDIALVYESTRLSYRDLNERSNRLASYLRMRYHIGPDDLVGLCLDRSEHMLIAILGVLKSGGAYVPMDPGYPTDRLRFILKDTSTRVVLTNEVHYAMLSSLCDDLDLCVDALDSIEKDSELCGYDVENPVKCCDSSNLAYVIYTSGTTGQPKGVMVEHKGVLNTLESIRPCYSFKKRTNMTSYTSYVFDVSVAETFIALLYGNTLHLISEELRTDILKLSSYLLHHNISHVYFPPVILSMLPRIAYPSLEMLIYAGEPCDADTGRYWSSRKRLFNYYGPTETSIYAIGKQISEGDVHLIGRPISNTSVYVLDDSLRVLPVGCIGELYIGGSGVARGYLNRPELTSERFIANPFQSETERSMGSNGRLYKTGDLVRYLPDGNLEYIGRNDFQIKIRGYRIETGEIESRLLGYEGVRHACVIAMDGLSGKYLVGYCVFDGVMEEDSILDYLGVYLPDYMVPSALVQLDSLPLTINGKLDRKALPEPSFRSSDDYVAPEDATESMLCSIYAQVLGIDNEGVGVHDDFFRMGGDSIVSIQLVSRLRQQAGIHVSVKDIFEHRSVRSLYRNVIRDSISSGIEILNLSEEVKPSAFQSWFLSQIEKNELSLKNNWNQSFIIRTEMLNIELLKEAVVKLVEYNNNLKLRYKENNKGKYSLYYEEVNQPNILCWDIRSISSSEGSNTFIEELKERLKLNHRKTNQPGTQLYHVVYIFGFKDGSSRIFLAMHNLIIDVNGWEILRNDLKRIYTEVEKGKILLKDKDDNFSSRKMDLSRQRKQNKKRKDLWTELKKTNKILQNDIRPWVLKDRGTNRQKVIFDKKITQQLLIGSKKAYYVNASTIVLMALCRSISILTGYKMHSIMFKKNGREKTDSDVRDLETITGCLTTIHTIHVNVIENNIEDNIKHAKECVREAKKEEVNYDLLCDYDSLPIIHFDFLEDKYESGSLNPDDWSIDYEYLGLSKMKQESNFVIDLEGAIIDEKLHISLLTKMSDDVTIQLTDIFKKTLFEIINHCVSKKETTYTPGDFTEDFIPYIEVGSTNLSSPIIFIFPPSHGGAESYMRTVVPKLKNNNLIIFNNYYLHLKEKLTPEELGQISYEFLAEYYINLIKEIQPKDKYYFFGWSFGGILGFEIARQISAKGGNVASLEMIDTFFNDYYVTNTLNIEAQKISPMSYNPQLNNKRIAEKIILYKATIMNKQLLREGDQDIINLYSYYISKSDNHLRDLINDDSVKIIPMHMDHFTWINDEKIVNLIINNNLETVK